MKTENRIERPVEQVEEFFYGGNGYLHPKVRDMYYSCSPLALTPNNKIPEDRRK